MLKLTRRGFIILGAATGLSACATYQATTFTPVVDVTPDEMLAAINKARGQNGSKPLIWNSALAQMAGNQARAMLGHGNMSHDFGSGQDLRDRATAVNYHGPIGENDAAGQTSLEETISDWMASPGHRANILDRNVNQVGVGTQCASQCTTVADFVRV